MNLPSKSLNILLIAVFLTGCAADSLHREGLRAVERGDFEAGVAKLNDAVRRDPGNLTFRMDMLSRTERSVQILFAEAEKAKTAGDSAAAERALRRVLIIEPSNARAKNSLTAIRADAVHSDRVVNAQRLMERQEIDRAEAELRAVLNEDGSFVPAQNLLSKLQSMRPPELSSPRLKTKDNRPVTLQFRDAQTKMVFEVLARQTGLNFIFDKDVKSDQKTTIFVSQVPVESAIDLILSQNQLAKQVLADNMVLIYPATPAKQKEYQDEIVHTFYLSNAAGKDVESLLKTVIGAKTLYVDERSNVVVMRDTPDHIRMAEKLVSSIDIAEPEVILEVEVLEAAHTLLDQLGIRYPSSATFTPTPIAGTASTTTGGTTVTASASPGMTINDYLNQTRSTIKVSQLSAGVDLLKTTGRTNVLSSPRIRAKNKEKAKIMIGDRVPVVTSGASSGVGNSAFATSSVQYLEVGLNLDVTPTIHLDGNVEIKVGLEVSSIVKEFDVATGSGGQTHVYQIGTRNATTTLELKDGETQVLAGLITDSDQKSSSHIPGLGDMPLLGRLFGTNGSNRSKSEIILSVTPHIIRSLSKPVSENVEFWYGNDGQTHSPPIAKPIDMSGKPGPAGTVKNGASQNIAAPASGAVALQRNVPARSDATAEESGSVSPVGAGDAATSRNASPTTAPSDLPTSDAKAASAPKATLTLTGPSAAKVGEDVSVEARVDGAAEANRLRTVLRFDPTALQYVSAEAGSAVSAGKIELHAGSVQVDSAGTPVDSSGSVVKAHFKVLAARSTILVSSITTLDKDNGETISANQATPLAITSTP